MVFLSEHFPFLDRDEEEPLGASLVHGERRNRGQETQGSTLSVVNSNGNAGI